MNSALLSYSRRIHVYVVLDPATLEELGSVPEMGLAETKEAIAAAEKALPAWSKTTPKVHTQHHEKNAPITLL